MEVCGKKALATLVNRINSLFLVFSWDMMTVRKWYRLIHWIYCVLKMSINHIFLVDIWKWQWKYVYECLCLFVFLCATHSWWFWYLEEDVSVGIRAITASGQTDGKHAESEGEQVCARLVCERKFHERSDNIYSVSEWVTWFKEEFLINSWVWFDGHCSCVSWLEIERYHWWCQDGKKETGMKETRQKQKERERQMVKQKKKKKKHVQYAQKLNSSLSVFLSYRVFELYQFHWHEQQNKRHWIKGNTDPYTTAFILWFIKTS